MSDTTGLFTRGRVVGMLHVPALPGTPQAAWPVPRIVDHVLSEAEVMVSAGVGGLLLENMHDLPYLRGKVGPEITAAMAVVAREVRRLVACPLGVQILAGANEEALAVALAAGLDFVRVEGFVFAHVADEGWMQACAGPLLRFRRMLGAGQVRIFADIKKKHSAHAVTADVDVVETARAAEFFGADGVIVTGIATGAEASVEDVARVAAGVRLPVLVGSGVTPANVASYLSAAEAVIVGSSLKQDGHWAGPLDPERVRRVVQAAAASRGLRNDD